MRMVLAIPVLQQVNENFTEEVIKDAPDTKSSCS